MSEILREIKELYSLVTEANDYETMEKYLNKIDVLEKKIYN